MSQITVRQATLADAAHITALVNATIDAWTRRDFTGEAIPTPYADLSLYERWLVGGPWTSVEMCAVHLANLLRGSDGIPLVAEIDGTVGGGADVFIGREADPFGHHINISRLFIHPDYADSGVSSALLTYIRQIGEAIRCKQITVADGEDHAALLEHHRYTRRHIGHPIRIAAQAGRVFYKAGDVTDFDPAQIAGWHMPLGRRQNARQAWDRLLPGFWNSVPEIVEPEAARLHLTITGQEAFVYMQQDRWDPESVHCWLWTRRPMNPLLMMALRDWAAQHEYAALRTFAWDLVLPALEVDYEPDGPTQHLYAYPL